MGVAGPDINGRIRPVSPSTNGDGFLVRSEVAGVAPRAPKETDS
jgi:hypothetical protein